MTITLNTRNLAESKEVLDFINERENVVFSNGNKCITGSIISAFAKGNEVEIQSNHFTEDSLNELKDEIVSEFLLKHYN